MEKQESGDLATQALINGKKLTTPKALTFGVAMLGIFVSVFHLYTAWFSAIPTIAQEWVTLHSLMILAFLVFPLRRKSWHDKLNWWFLVDLLCITLLITFTTRLFITYEHFISVRIHNADSFDIFAGTVTFIIVLELTRRVLGWTMTILAGFLIIQGLFSDHIPSPLYGPPISWKSTVEFLYLQAWGLWNIPAQVVSRFIILFFVLVAIWKYTRILETIRDMATSVAGRFTGGPAKVAVVASALFGTIQGSSLSNVVSSGSWSIPTMRATGYKRHFAGAVEAVASSGGLITPPVMGLAAFLMADFLAIPYLWVMAAAIIPTLLFYTATFAAVHFEAKREGLAGLPASEIPTIKHAFSRSWLFIIPLCTLILFLVQGFSIAKAVMWAIIILFALTFVLKDTRLTPQRLLIALEEGGRSAVTIGVAVAVVGLIMGSFWATGLGLRLSELIVAWSGGHLWLGLIVGGVVAIILGMGIPFTPAYIILYLFAIPALINMGAQPLTAHFFALFFALISGITPPVALTAYAAAGLAGASMLRTAFTAMKIGLPLYFIPFFFVYKPVLLGQGHIFEVVVAAVTGIIGTIILSAGLGGWLLRKASSWERLFLFGSGLLLLYPGLVTDLVSVSVFGLVLLSQWRFGYREPLQPMFNMLSRIRVRFSRPKKEE